MAADIPVIGDGRSMYTHELEGMRMKERPMLIDSSMDDGGWREPRPFNPVFKACLFAVTQVNPEVKRMGIYYEPTLNKEKQQKQYNVGVFESKFEGWGLVLNWTPERKDAIPPRHIAVGYEDKPVAVIGPYLDIRQCWKCGLHGFSDEAKRHPWVVPGRPCPRCHQSDWFAYHVTPNELHEAAASLVADSMSAPGMQERWFSALDGDGARARSQAGDNSYGIDRMPSQGD